MKLSFLEFAACPKCQGRLRATTRSSKGAEVEEGALTCESCGATFPIVRGIPRFVESERYAESFGYEWTEFRRLRSDKYTGVTLQRDTILSRSGWQPADLAGKVLLECGCGAGDDTSVLGDLGADTILSFDLSTAVDVARENNQERENVHYFQADIFAIPIRKASMDVVYCHRVIQHTPDPGAAFRSMESHLKRNDAMMFLHSYDRHWRSLLQSKYWLRPLIRKADKETVLRHLKRWGPYLYPVAGFLNRLRVPGVPLGPLLARLLVPFENVEEAYKAYAFSKATLYETSLQITFDALTPVYDNPSSAATMRRWFEQAGFGRIVCRQRNPVVMIGYR